MKHLIVIFFFAYAIAVVANGQTNWVTQASNGAITYGTSAMGDRILDYSYAGYGGGGVAIPVAPVAVTVSPSGGDDTAAIQAAINSVAQMPLVNNLRGAVLLTSGTFNCSQQITISTNGVVLRGSGSGQAGSVINMTGSAHTCIVLQGQYTAGVALSGSIPVVDAYVPSGTTTLTLQSTQGLAVGETVLVQYLRTAQWINFMGMSQAPDTVVVNGVPKVWLPAGEIDSYERTIQAIQGNSVTLDVPLTDCSNSAYLSAVQLVPTTPSTAMSQCGIESLSIVSPPPTGTLADPQFLGIGINACQDCWVKNIALVDSVGVVSVTKYSRRITVQDVSVVHNDSVDPSDGYPADYSVQGSQVLFNRCNSQGDNDIYMTTQYALATLNVVLNGVYQGDGNIQPHEKWSTGLLVDSCVLPDGSVQFINRGTGGDFQGWAIGWGVVWNCQASYYDIEQPPGTIEWSIGCIDSSGGTPVLPGSLYYAQLRERLGPPDCIPFPPKHRYSFSGIANAAIADGANIADSIGTATASMRGGSATYTSDGSGINLQGGSTTNKAYIDLPNGVVTGTYGGGTRYTSSTYEAWVTFHSTQNGAQLFDFGTSSIGEVTGTGGTFNGTNTQNVALSANNNGSTAPFDQLSRNYSGGTTDVYSDVPATAVSNVPYHIVLVYDASVQDWRWYRNGVLMQTLYDPQGLSTLNDVNNWLGRSMFSTDPNLNAIVNEFRVYDYALTDAQITGNFNAGPDKINTISDSTFGPNAMSGSGVVSLNGATDTFNFDAQTLTGDFTVQTKLLSVTGTNTNAVAGLMIREGTASNARDAFIGLTPQGLSRFITRTTTGGSASKVDVSGYTLPQWLRLVRVGNNISAYVSPDGTTWTQQGSTTTFSNLSTTLQFGCAVASGTSASTALAQFDQFYIIATTVNVTASRPATNTSPITFAITFSEPVTGLSAAGITITNGTKGALSGTGANYTIPVTPTAQGAVTCQVMAAAAQGASGNSTASNVATVTYDTIPPTAVVTPPGTITGSSPIPFTVTFSEPVTGLTASGITVTNGTAGALTGTGTTYTIPITPSGQGTVTCRVAGGAAQDAAGNGNVASNIAAVTYDSIPPTVTVTPSGSVTNTSPLVFTLAFSKVVTGLTAADIVVTNGSAGVLSGSGATYTLSVTPGAQGTVTCQVMAAAVQDAAGNYNTASNIASVIYDTVGPLVTISEPSTYVTMSGPVSYSVTYLDPYFSASTLAVSNITLNQTGSANGTVTVSGSGATRTVTISNITGNGTLGISIAAGTSVDTVGNSATAAGPSSTFLVSASGPVTKAATGTELSAGASWSGSAAPSSTQVAAWTSSSFGAGLTLATPAAWGGINVAGALGNIAITGTGTLMLDAGGMDLSVSTVNLTVSTPLLLAANENWNVNSGKTLTASGIISGPFRMMKTGSGTLTLTGSNTFSGGLTIKTGTLTLNTTAAAAGTGPITLGDSAGGSNATLDLYASSGSYANNIIVAAGSSGTMNIANQNGSGGQTLTGPVALNNNLNVYIDNLSKSVTFTNQVTECPSGSGPLTIATASNATGQLVFSGGVVVGSGGLTFANNGTSNTSVIKIGTVAITGTGNLIFDANNAASITVSPPNINNIGSITNSGSSSGTTTISGVIGASVTQVIQNSAASQLTLSNTGNAFSGGLYINAGTVYDGGNNPGAFGTGAIYLGSAGSSASATLQTGLNSTGAPNPIVVQAAAPGATLTIQMVAGNNSNATLPGDITLNHDLVLNNPISFGKTLTLSGDVNGAGNLLIALSGSGNLQLSGASINHNGTITNSGTGAGTATISGAIGSSVTGIVQNSASSPMNISGSNSYAGNTTVTAGTLSISSACLARSSTVSLATGATFNLVFSGTDTIHAFYIDGVRQSPGTWGPINSTATYTTALITGTGMLNVATGPSFEDWINSFPNLSAADRAMNADPNGDGLTNEEEFVLGMNPTLPNKPPLTISAHGLSFVATGVSGPGYTGLTRYWTVETTTDLSDPGSWQPLGGYSNITGTGQTVIVPISNGTCGFYRLNVNLQ